MTAENDEEFWLRLPPGSRIWLLDDDNRVVCATVTPHSGFGTIEWWPDARYANEMIGPAGGYVRTETVTHQPLIQPKMVQGVEVPEDIDLKEGRCSQADRERVEDYLADLHEQGYMGDEEFTARAGYVRKAITRHHLAMLTSDLPAPPMPKRPVKEPKSLRERLSEPKAQNVVMILLVCLCYAVLIWGLAIAN